MSCFIVFAIFINLNVAHYEKLDERNAHFHAYTLSDAPDLLWCAGNPRDSQPLPRPPGDRHRQLGRG